MNINFVKHHNSLFISFELNINIVSLMCYTHNDQKQWIWFLSNCWSHSKWLLTRKLSHMNCSYKLFWLGFIMITSTYFACRPRAYQLISIISDVSSLILYLFCKDNMNILILAFMMKPPTIVPFVGTRRYCSCGPPPPHTFHYEIV